jgi:hypothetical protein
MTLEELGRGMGMGGGESDAARKSARNGAHQFLRRRDPRVSSVRRFAAATGVSVVSLVRAG